MIIIAFSLLASALWLILSPYSLMITLSFLALIFLVPLALYLQTLTRPSFPRAFSTSELASNTRHYSALFMMVGMALGIALYLPKLIDFQKAVNEVHTQVNRVKRYQFKVLKNPTHYDRLTIELRAKGSLLNGKKLYLSLNNALLKEQMPISSLHEAELSIDPIKTVHRPNQPYRRLYLLANELIGRAALANPDDLITLKSANRIETTRNTLYHYFDGLTQYENRAYFSALTVGITDSLTQHDWNVLRKTGTIHLVSISGLHLTFVAFWSFLILRYLIALFKPIRFAPYQLAALLSIGVALFYALLAGLSLPTERALLMYIIAMVTLLLHRPIFRLHTLAITFIIMMMVMPLALLSIGFWLSFTAVAILILLSQYRWGVIKTLLLTQLTVSFFLMPLTAHFFGEVSLISPLTNLLAIPWTTLYILPTLLIGTLLLPFEFLWGISLSTPFFTITNLALRLFRYGLDNMVMLPYSSIKTPYIALFPTVILTLLLLLFLRRKRTHTGRWHLNKSLSTLCLILCLMLLIGHYLLPKKPKEGLYLMPVGEGLSALVVTDEITFLYDTGRYFRQFDPGRDVILPTLNRLNIQAPDALILSLYNGQHTGGTRSLLTKHPQTPVFTHPSLLAWTDGSRHCHEFQHESKRLTITPIKAIKSSCSYFVRMGNELMILLSDPTIREFRNLIIDLNQALVEHQTKNDDALNITLLFPKQGQSRGYTDFYAWKELIKKHDVTFLFSTRTIQEEYYKQPELEPYLNAYDGTLRLPFNPSKTDYPHEINQAIDCRRFWWINCANNNQNTL